MSSSSIIKLGVTDGTHLFVFQEDDGSIRVENYAGVGTNQSRCLWGQTLSAEQARELRDFLQVLKL